MRWCNETFFYVLGTCAIGGAAIASALSVNMEDAVHPEFRMGLLAPRQAATKTNLQTFTGALGDIKASAIQSSGNRDKPFEVDSETFNDFKTAANRACDNQFNGCQRFANDNQKKPGAFTVGDCDKQNVACKSAANATPVTSFDVPPPVLVSSNAEFDFYCDA